MVIGPFTLIDRLRGTESLSLSSSHTHKLFQKLLQLSHSMNTHFLHLFLFYILFTFQHKSNKIIWPADIILWLNFVILCLSTLDYLSQYSLFMLRLRHLQGKTSFSFSTGIYFFIFMKNLTAETPKTQ